jgi:hypothetical protein
MTRPILGGGAGCGRQAVAIFRGLHEQRGDGARAGRAGVRCQEVPCVCGRGLHSSTFQLNVSHFVEYVGCMTFPQSIRQGDTGRCDENG